MASLTRTYTAAHSVFAEMAEVNGYWHTTPFGVRLLLALYERLDCKAGTDTLAGDLGADGSAIRRAYPPLIAAGLVTSGSVGGGPTKRGVRAMLTLTEDGRRCGALIFQAVNERAR